MDAAVTLILLWYAVPSILLALWMGARVSNGRISIKTSLWHGAAILFFVILALKTVHFVQSIGWVYFQGGFAEQKFAGLSMSERVIFLLQITIENFKWRYGFYLAGLILVLLFRKSSIAVNGSN